jgi:hypothetical protein
LPLVQPASDGSPRERKSLRAAAKNERGTPFTQERNCRMTDARPMLTLPAGIFTASVLFDILALIPERSEQAHAYEQRAADLLRFGLSSTLSALALKIVDYLRKPARRDGSSDTRKIALNGALIAIYLLDLAARQKRLSEAGTPPGKDVLPVGLSLLGLAFVGISDRLA